MAQVTTYAPTVPPASGDLFQNMNLNPFGSYYGTLGLGHTETALIQRQLENILYRTAPMEFIDLRILQEKSPRTVKSDEFMVQEMGYGRDPMVVAANFAGGGSSTTITVTTGSFAAASIDQILVLPDNSKVTITAKTAPDQVTITAQTGNTLPALVATDVLPVHGGVEGDGMNTFSNYSRYPTIERYNYVQFFLKAQRWGRVERFKYEQAGTLTNYLAEQKNELLFQFRVDISNAYWNGTKGEVTLASGLKAKTMSGVYPSMLAAGSYGATTTLAGIRSGVESMVFNSLYGSRGQTKFLYGESNLIYECQKAWKDEKVRYNPGDRFADLTLDYVNMGATRVVFVPMQRFADTASFPASWQRRLLLIDQEAITPVQMWPEMTGETLPRQNNGTRENFHDFWVEGNKSQEMINPLSCAYLNIV